MDREGWGTNWLGMGDGDGTRHSDFISHVVFKSVLTDTVPKTETVPKSQGSYLAA